MQVSNEKLSFPVIFQKIEDIGANDIRFTKVKIWLMHLGVNENGCEFTKECVDKAIPTLQYIPIVGFIEKNSLSEEDFSDHRYVKVFDDKGLRKKYAGHAYGVVLSSEDNNAHYEDRLCDDGITRTFLVVDGVIWNQFEDSATIMNRDLIKSHSMELVDEDEYIVGHEDENGIFHYEDFTFRASCILGKFLEPAMLNSTVEVQFTVTEFVKSIQSELQDKFAMFNDIVSKNNQGGKEEMPKLNEDIIKVTDFSQTVLEQLDNIRSLVSNFEKCHDRWGEEISRYSLADVQGEEVILIDRKANYSAIGFPLSFDGETPVVDFTKGSNKKIEYANYGENDSVPEVPINFSKEIIDIEESLSEKVTDFSKKLDEANATIETMKADLEKVNTEFSTMKSEYEEIKPKYEEFVKAEQERKAKELEEAKNSLFTKFDSHLTDVEEYADIKANADSMTYDEINTKCSILFTKKSLSSTTDFSKTKDTSMVVDIPEEIESEDGYIQTKYGNIPIKH